MVRVTGIEPAQPFDHKNLNLTRLPVPPHPHIKFSFNFYTVKKTKTESGAKRFIRKHTNSPEKQGYCIWCDRRDLNPYEKTHTPLKRARIPIPPRSHISLRYPQRFCIISLKHFDVNKFFNFCLSFCKKNVNSPYAANNQSNLFLNLWDNDF